MKDKVLKKYAAINQTEGTPSDKSHIASPGTPVDRLNKIRKEANLISSDELLILHTNAPPEAKGNNDSNRTPPNESANRIQPITENSIETSDIPWLGSTHPLDEWNDSEEYDDV